jgi:hypothetical protein
VLGAHPLLAVFPGWETIVGRLPDEFATKGSVGLALPHHTRPTRHRCDVPVAGATDEHVARFSGATPARALDGVLSATG